MTTSTVTRTRTGISWGSLSPLAGIAFAVLFLVGIMTRGTTPEYTESAESFASFFGDSGNRIQMIVGSYLMILAGLAFLWLLVNAYSRVRDAAASSSRLSLAMLTSGTLFVGLLLVAAIAMAAVPGSMSFGGAPYPGAEFAIQMEQLGFALLLLPGMLAAAICVASLSIAARNAKLLPSWLTTAGLVSAVILLFSPLFLPAVVLPLWILVVGIVSLRRQQSLI